MSVFPHNNLRFQPSPPDDGSDSDARSSSLFSAPSDGDIQGHANRMLCFPRPKISADDAANGIIRTNASTMTTSTVPSPSFLVKDGPRRRILRPCDFPPTVGRMISDIIPGDGTLHSALRKQHPRDSIPSLSKVIELPIQLNGQLSSPSQRQCPLPTPEHESVGMNLNVATSDKPPSEAFHSPVVSHPYTPTAFLCTPPHTPSTKPSSVNLDLAPLVVVVNPTPQPTPHGTPPATPTLVVATPPSFIKACGVVLGPDLTSNTASIQSPFPTTNAPALSGSTISTISPEDYETESDLEEDEEEAGSWASEDISEGDDEEMVPAQGRQKGGSSRIGKRSHHRGGSKGSRGKGPSSGHSRTVGPLKAKAKSPLQAPAQQTKSSGLQQQPQRPAAPQLYRRHTSTAIHPQAQASRRLLSKEDEAALKFQATAVEAQRQRELFVKIPVQSAMPRTRSGLLSQLMNPDPSIFPPNHPYRQSCSAVDLRKMATVPRVVSAGAGGFPIHSGGNVVATLPSVDDLPNGHVRRPSEQAPKLPPIVGSWRSTKGAAAVPLAAEVTVSNVPATNQNSGPGAYRPKGRPQEEELEDDTDTDGNNSVPMSQSYVYQKLAQIAGRRSAAANGKQRADTAPHRPAPIRALTTTETSSHDARISATPVPLAYPYNLPPPSPPSTPRTTRQRFLQSEIPINLRKVLLQERQASKMNLGPHHQSTGTGEGAAGRPGHLTMRSIVQLSAKTSNTSVKETDEKERQRQREREAKENEERMCRVLAQIRNHSWMDDYHASRW